MLITAPDSPLLRKAQITARDALKTFDVLKEIEERAMSPADIFPWSGVWSRRVQAELKGRGYAQRRGQ